MSEGNEDCEEFPGRLLHQAALWDNAELLEDLLHGDQSVHLNCRDGWGRTPLHAAATTDSSRCLKILLQAGADLNIKSGPRVDGRTCLQVASEHGATENVSLMLAHGADIFVQDLHGLTALDIAEQANHRSCMEILKQTADAKEIAREEVFTSLQEACSSGDVNRAKTVIQSLAGDFQIVNSTPNGSNTLLFKACEAGQKEIVKLLLDSGADGRIHPVTKYSPLYIACYYGRKDIVDLLIKKFPRLVSVCTVEKWLPIHACVINGHYASLELLLKYPYPKEIVHKFRDKLNAVEYEMPYDINLRDVTGQSVLYLASYVGHQKLVDILLKHRVRAKYIKPQHEHEREKSEGDILPEDASSPTRHKIAGSIHSLMTKLNLVKETIPSENMISPLNIDLYCNNNTETALHVAVKNRHHNIVSMLLTAGANPNLRMYLPDDDMTRPVDDEYIFTGSTALVEACRNRDMGMIDLLLKNNARDDECKALFITSQAKDEIIISKLLALKSFPDPDYKINKKAFDVKPNLQFPATSLNTSGIYSSLVPAVPAMINWHRQHSLTYIKDQWLIDAAVTQNPKLRLSPRNQVIALYAITRLDISKNSLCDLPECIFQLPSLRILMASQNKLERLPMSLGYSLVDGTATLPRKNKKNALLQATSVLEEIHLKDNRLISLPDGLFHLPALQHLDVSNNKLSCLPYKIWSAPKLKELNASFNLLHTLPARKDDFGSAPAKKTSEGTIDTSSEISDEESLSSTGEAITENLSEEISSCGKLSDGKKVLSLGKHGNAVTCCRKRDLVHHSLWSSALRIQDTLFNPEEEGTETASMLQSLNLSHNNFSVVPPGLSCLATSLLRLNLSFNRLSEIGLATVYPSTLKQLDLSHNYIQAWPQLPHCESMENIESSHSAFSCYAMNDIAKSQKAPSRRSTLSITQGRSRSSSCSSSGFGACVHRRHSRLENIRTLILADNQLTRLSLHFDENLFDIISENDDNDNTSAPTTNKTKLRYPSVSMLDISNNRLKEVPTNLHELSNLSVLNIAGNVDITELPPEMGLLSRLWNLNTRGCSLQEPLKSMIESKKYKTMDVIGYLKSILEDARVYARMKLMVVGVQGIGKTSLLEQLRMEGSGPMRKKPVEHWAKRMGNRNINTRTAKGTTLSTVGVDISDWQYEKKIRGHSSYGPVTFRTWDFGGQKEYYATHQYFLSKRSLYLVVWNICEGEKGVDEILQWLVNIQARAPNSPVVIVGTHFDLVKDKFGSSWSEELQRMIRDRFINVIDADKLGLPRVLDTIEISCKTRHNIKLLCNLIYDTVFSLRTPGSKEKLLEQRVPASYLALEDVVYSIASDRRSHNKDPVLPADKYQAVVSHEMAANGYKPFRDLAELSQATAFLHENGVLLHYEDVTLKDLYFLDPQWLCDMLSHVLTIREINPFVKHGVMRLEDLQLVFKSSTCAPIDAKSYIVNLLNKFEVALAWDNRTLLIPSLLPSSDLSTSGLPGTDVRIPVRCRAWPTRNKNTSTGVSCIGSSALSLKNPDSEKSSCKSWEHASANQVNANENQSGDTLKLEVTHRFNPQAAVRRLFLMSYFPSGFWSRLLTRILADDAFADIVRNYFILPEEVVGHEDFSSALGGQAQWKCWQTGIELLYAHTTLFRLQETPFVRAASTTERTSRPGKQLYQDHSSLDYRSMKFLMKIESLWTDIEVKSSAVLEIFLPSEAVVIKRSASSHREEGGILGKGIQSVVLDPSPECVARLLSATVDHIDTLLEDWYPALGTRFVHTSEGKFLVTRVVPCPACLECHGSSEVSPHPSARLFPDNWGSYVEMNPLYSSMSGSVLAQTMKRTMADPAHTPGSDAGRPGDLGRRDSWQSGASAASDRDSGVGPDSASSSRNPSAEGRPDPETIAEEENTDVIEEMTPVVYSFMVEECILAGYAARAVVCPLHGPLLLSQITPDIVFLDLGDHFLVRPENIKQGKLLGRGGFGFVFEGTLNRIADDPRQIALKMLQPVDPGHCARQSAISAFKAAQSKWERDPLQYACKAYCSARQEVNILMSLKHPNIVPLIGVCPRPLSLVLELAPQGSLDLCLKHHRRSGARLHLLTLQAIILQISKALEYLHGQHIIYRDLKSENILVWDLPSPFSKDNLQRVDTRLADYGISRSSLPTGAKGFGGTEGFMAPEMMRHNGEEEYTEKVDCFSFGMFMYELLTARQPYEQCDNVKEHVLEGGRPSLNSRETEYPVYMLDLMVSCWSQQPKHRPSASQVVAIASAPEFTHLLDVISLDHSFDIAGALRVVTAADSGDIQEEDTRVPFANVWIARTSSQLDILDIGEWTYNEHTSIEGLPDQITAMCQVNQYIWLGDTFAKIHAYRIEDKNWIFSYSLDPESPCTSVRGMCAITALDKVAVALSNGRLFMCRADTKPTSPVMGEGTFILSELAGFSGDIFTLARVHIDDYWALWCGGSDGIMSIFTLRNDGMVMNQEAASHFLELDSSKTESRDVKLLYTVEPNGNLVHLKKLESSIWTYVQPGCMVYHWDARNRRILNKLDCSKLVPCSESLESISIEEHLSPDHCQVSSIAVCNTELFVGTAWGCVIVAEAETMRPISIFRPFESEVRSIIPLISYENSENSFEEPLMMVATIGKGYRNLLNRYTHMPKSSNIDSSRSIFCLLWKSYMWINS